MSALSGAAVAVSSGAWIRLWTKRQTEKLRLCATGLRIVIYGNRACHWIYFVFFLSSVIYRSGKHGIEAKGASEHAFGYCIAGVILQLKALDDWVRCVSNVF